MVTISFDLTEKIESIFEKEREKIGAETELKLSFLDSRPIVNENVYGEAFPEESEVNLDVFAPDAVEEEIRSTIIHELTHIKHPDLIGHCDAFLEKVQGYRSMEVN